jgi:hypothetical protein
VLCIRCRYNTKQEEDKAVRAGKEIQFRSFLCLISFRIRVMYSLPVKYKQEEGKAVRIGKDTAPSSRSFISFRLRVMYSLQGEIQDGTTLNIQHQTSGN